MNRWLPLPVPGLPGLPLKLAAVVLALAGLQGCGGSEGGGSLTSTGTLAGFYTATSPVDLSPGYAIVTYTPFGFAFRTISLQAGFSGIGQVAQHYGSLAVSGTEVQGFGFIASLPSGAFPPGDGRATAFTEKAAGTFTGGTLTLSFTPDDPANGPATTTTFEADPRANLSIDPSALGGTYRAPAGATSTGLATTITVGSDGTLSGTDPSSGATVAGALAEFDPGQNGFRIGLTSLVPATAFVGQVAQHYGSLAVSGST